MRFFPRKISIFDQNLIFPRKISIFDQNLIFSIEKSAFLTKKLTFSLFLRKSATPKSLDLQREPKISENLQKSAKMCVPGPVSPFCCLPFSAPWHWDQGNPGVWVPDVPTYRHTPTGSYSRKGVLLPSGCLLESSFLEALLRTLLRSLLPCMRQALGFF